MTEKHLRIRHGKLINKKFLEGLTPREAQELEQINNMLDAVDEEYFAPTKQNQSIRRVFLDTVLRFKQELNTENESYWQGRKDGMRSVMVLLENAPIDVSGAIERSPGYVPLERELLHGLLEDAVYNVAAILHELDELHRVDIRTKQNLSSFVSRYDYLAAHGHVPIISNHC